MKRFWPFAVLVIVVLVIWFWLNPPRFWLNMTKQVEPSPEVGAQLVEKYQCRRCHRIGGEGALKAPDLSGITKRVDDPAHVTLRLWLRNPRAIKPNTAMPNFHLSDTEIEAILLYLEALDEAEASQ